MKTKDVPYEVLVLRNPYEMEQIRNKISVSPSSYTVKKAPIKDLPYPGSFKFHYEYSVTCGGSTMGKDFMNVIRSGKIQRDHDAEKEYQNTATIEQKITRHLAKVGSVVLTAYAVGSTRSFGVRLADGYYPTELIEEITESEIQTNNERIRQNNLTPEQRQTEQNEILRQLNMSPGFAHMRVLPFTIQPPEKPKTDEKKEPFNRFAID